MSISVKDLIFSMYFLKLFAMLIQDLKEILQDQVHIVKTHISKFLKYISQQ